MEMKNYFSIYQRPIMKKEIVNPATSQLSEVNNTVV